MTRRRGTAGQFLGAALGLGTLVLAACASSQDVDCAGPGVYQRGKEGGASCCANLNEYYRLAASGSTNELTCQQPVGHAEFGCIEGRCGDGRCELGERGACGCTLDCSPE
jgi:hypothetical protein